MRWEIDGGMKKYRFLLKKNILFHNNQILNAHDVANSFLRQFDSTNIYYRKEIPSIFEEIFKKSIDRIEVINDFELIFSLTNPNSLFLHLLSSPCCSGIISRESLKQYIDNNEFIPIGSGPYFFERKDKEGNIYLKSFEKHHEYSPTIKELKFFVSNQSKLENLALQDSIDILYRIQGSMVERFRSDETFQIFVMPTLSTFYLGFNTANPFFLKSRIRKRTSAQINRLKILSTFNRTNAEIANGPLPSGIWNSKPSESMNQNDNVDSSEIIKPPDNPIEVIGYISSPRAKFAYSEIIKFVRNGKLELRENYYSDWNSFFDMREKGRYDMFFGTWRSDFVGDPYFFLYDLFHSQSANNYFHYKSSPVDSLLDLARITDSRDVRNKYYQQILDIIDEDAPAVFIHHPKEVFVVNKRLSPIIIDPYGYIHYEKITNY